MRQLKTRPDTLNDKFRQKTRVQLNFPNPSQLWPSNEKLKLQKAINSSRRTEKLSIETTSYHYMTKTTHKFKLTKTLLARNKFKMKRSSKSTKCLPAKVVQKRWKISNLLNWNRLNFKFKKWMRLIWNVIGSQQANIPTDQVEVTIQGLGFQPFSNHFK